MCESAHPHQVHRIVGATGKRRSIEYVVADRLWCRRIPSANPERAGRDARFPTCGAALFDFLWRRQRRRTPHQRLHPLSGDRGGSHASNTRSSPTEFSELCFRRFGRDEAEPMRSRISEGKKSAVLHPPAPDSVCQEQVLAVAAGSLKRSTWPAARRSSRGSIRFGIK